MTVAHTRHAHLDCANAGHDRPLRQVAVPNQALSAVIGALVGMFREKACYFGFDSSSKQRSCAVAQNIGQSIGEGPWLSQSKNVSVGHGVSLLRWRSGGVKHPHDTPPYPFIRHQLSRIAPGAAGPVQTVRAEMPDPDRQPAGRQGTLVRFAITFAGRGT
jgi:hypothetical protein